MIIKDRFVRKKEPLTRRDTKRGSNQLNHSFLS